MISKFRNFISYNTGKYKIFSYQNGFDLSKVNKIYLDIKNNDYDYFKENGIISGCRDNNIFYITEGNHRMLAALKYYKDSGDYLPVEKLIKNGIFNDTKPINYFKFPI